MSIKNKLKNILLSDIRPYPKNAKIHDLEQIQFLSDSIKEYDLLDPIIIGTDNVIISGHGRYLALKAQDAAQTIEVIDASYLEPEKQRKLRITLNKSVSNEWDLDLLADDVKELYTKIDYEKIKRELNITQEEIEKHEKILKYKCEKCGHEKWQ